MVFKRGYQNNKIKSFNEDYWDEKRPDYIGRLQHYQVTVDPVHKN